MDEPIPVSRAVDFGTAKLMPDVDRERAWLLTLDGSPQSYVDQDDPRHLAFEYARRVAHLLDTAAAPGAPLDTLHLGAGALTLPRYLDATRPGSAQLAVDADGELLSFVTRHLPLPSGSGITLEARDALAVLQDAEPASRGAAVADVYSGTRVPAHLTTVSWARALARVLRPGGICAVNIADAAPFGFAAAQLANLREAFAHLCVIAEPRVLDGGAYGNIVIGAARQPLPLGELAARCGDDDFPARVVHGAALHRLIGDAQPVPDGEAAPSPVPPPGAFTVG